MDLLSSVTLASPRATPNSLEVLSLLLASFLYVLCQVLDLCALQHEFELETDTALNEEIARSFGCHLSEGDLAALFAAVARQIHRSLETIRSNSIAAMRRDSRGGTL